MPQNILIIEDEPGIADTIVYALQSEGFATMWRSTGGEGLQTLTSEPFALIVLDVGLPDINGFELCKQIRAQSAVPILFLTARNNEIDRVVGLEIGGDDYLTKPFSPRELAARVRAILRRTNGHSHNSAPPLPPSPSVPPSRFSIDDLRCQICWCGQALDLTATEYRLLKTLLEQPRRVFTREQLLYAAWNEPEASLERTVDAHIKTLRAKLRAISPDDDPIQTHRSLGYSFKG